MTDDSLTLAEGVNVLELGDEFQTLFPSFGFLESYPTPTPGSNMTVEVNTICFVAFL